jgi:hypothetical protein
VRAFATLVSVARARLRHAGQRLGLRAALIAGCVLAGAVFLGFALAALTVALTARVGLLQALVIIAGAALVLVLVLVGLLAVEARRERRLAARRASLDRELLRAATLSAAIPHAARLPTRAGLGLGLVALGALLVLARRRDADED